MSERTALNVLITFALEDDLVQQVRAVDPRIDARVLGQHARRLFRGELRYPSQLEEQTARQDLAAAMSDAEVLFGFWGNTLVEMYPDPAVLREKGPALRWVQLTSAGVDRAARSGLVGSEFLVTNASGVHATPIGEYVLCIMLMFCKGAVTFVRAQQQRQWTRFMSRELFGKTVGIVGYGHIGEGVAQLAKAFGCRIIATRRSVTEASSTDLVDELLPPSGLPRLLAESDFVVLAVPLTDDTRHMIDDASLKSMKPTAVLINIARGAVIDTEALLRALKNGTIAGAGLDVFEQEPLPPDHELWSMENVIISPHISGGTEIYNQRAVAIFCENLRRYLAGEPLLNLVDAERGY